MEKYIDCDGVILNTESIVLDLYSKCRNISNFYQNVDWFWVLNQAYQINNGINLLKDYYSDNVHILTRVYSGNEMKAKTEFFRDNGVRNDIIFVQNNYKKCDVVEAKGNILVDDTIHNLHSWHHKGGIPIGFMKTYHGYGRIVSLDEVLDDSKLEKVLQKIK